MSSTRAGPPRPSALTPTPDEVINALYSAFGGLVFGVESDTAVRDYARAINVPAQLEGAYRIKLNIASDLNPH